MMSLLRYVTLFIGAICIAAPAIAGEAFFDSDGVQIRYLESGRGEPVVLLHGFAMSADDMWVKSPLIESKMIAYLERDFRVIALDLRGHGQSDKPQDVKQYGSEMSDDVVRLLDHLQLKQAHVVGYSLGAAISGKLLVSYPDRLQSVTLGGGAPVYKPTKQTVAIMNSVAESLDRGDGIGPLFQLLNPSGEPAMPKTVADTVGKRLVSNQDQTVLAAVVRGIADLEVTEEQLAANKVPVLFLYGSREGEAKERITQVRKVLTNAKTVVISGGDHFTTFAAPKFRKDVRAFLKAQSKNE